MVYCSRFLTVWYLLSAHVERLLAVYGRAGSKQWCTVFRTKCVILTIFILSLVAFLHYIWSHVIVLHRGILICKLMQESIVHINRLRRVELVGASWQFACCPFYCSSCFLAVPFLSVLPVSGCLLVALGILPVVLLIALLVSLLLSLFLFFLSSCG